MPDTKQVGTERLECIGIAGSGPSVGVTHFSLMTAAYLSGVLCRRTAVLEQNESGSFAQLEKIFRTGKRREKPVIDGAGQPFEIRGIFFYQKAERRMVMRLFGKGDGGDGDRLRSLDTEESGCLFSMQPLFSGRFRSADGSWQILRHWQQKSKMEKMV